MAGIFLAVNERGVLYVVPIIFRLHPTISRIEPSVSGVSIVVAKNTLACCRDAVRHFLAVLGSVRLCSVQ